MNTFFIRVTFLEIVSGQLRFLVEVKGTDGTDSVDGYNFNPAQTGEQLNTALVNAVKLDFGATGDRFILLGGSSIDVVK